MKSSVKIFIQLLPFLFCVMATAQVSITIDFNQPSILYSKYIFGKNNTLNSLAGNSGTPSPSEWTKFKDSGITVFRENGGNNSTKYNWRAKLSSHPNWYNNVYPNDWDHLAGLISGELAGRKAVFGFQLIGRVASSKDHNFNDWEYNGSQWWTGVEQNLAGGGTVNPAGGAKALVEGNPALYTKEWPADSTVAILDHWFKDLEFDQNQFQYWCMDNEPEIWDGTHDDVVGSEQTAEQFIQLYIGTAKKARAAYPSIKLIGPIAANEWQWYNWHNQRVNYNGKSYCYLEYFIMRIAEEQKASGIRLLDVLGLHFYPGSSKIDEVIQYYRVFFDESYIYPEANGVRAVNGGWDNAINKEFIFKRAEQWLNTYMGANHGVTLGMTETGVAIQDPDAVAVWYSSTLGEFMKHQVELFTPWDWKPVMWEVVHLFSRYSFDNYVPTVSENENLVSAYVTTDTDQANATTIIVNRKTTGKQTVNLKFQGKYPDISTIQAMQLDNVPATETFISHEQNALKTINYNTGYTYISLSMEPLSVVTLSFKTTTEVPTGLNDNLNKTDRLKIYPNPVIDSKQINISLQLAGFRHLDIFNAQGLLIRSMNADQFYIDDDGLMSGQLNTQGFKKGLYLVRAVGARGELPHKLIIY